MRLIRGKNAFDSVFKMDQIERIGLKQLVVNGEKLKVNPRLFLEAAYFG